MKWLASIGLLAAVVAIRITQAEGVTTVGSGACDRSATFFVGSGISDITGPAAELGMMGYARPDQRTAGIHTRLWSRAFVIGSPCNDRRVALVVADLGMITQAVSQSVIEKLRQRYGELYSEQNVLLAATHTHSGPGGYSYYALYNLTTFGFDQQNFNAIVDGIVASIGLAHDNIVAGNIRIASGELMNASVNRSLQAYLENFSSELPDIPFDTDKTMTLLRLDRLDGGEVGSINWFPVHGTSMGNDNLLISGDNKGFASYLFEKHKGTEYPTDNTFVAAFGQSSEGDVSPNIFGGTEGGGDSDRESTELSGRKQFNKALELYENATTLLTGAVGYRHTYVKMDDVLVAPDYADGVERRTCPAAIGFSMLAGAEDGPGFGDEGAVCNRLDDFFGAFTCTLLTTQCQGEKPIVLETGNKHPFPWSPEVLPLQIIRIGALAIVAVPFEVTTVAGRRLRQSMEKRLTPAGIETVVIANLANAYTGYLATRAEYSLQHYEGASTYFGPWTLAAVEQELERLGSALSDGVGIGPSPAPRDLRCCQNTLIPGVIFDDKPLFKRFGSVHRDTSATYGRGDTATVTFWGAHPRNDLMTGRSYLDVQRKLGDAWTSIATDLDWETTYRWRRILCPPSFACSHITIEWHILETTTPGLYRIRHQGHWKSGWNGRIRAYSGASRTFTVK